MRCISEYHTALMYHNEHKGQKFDFLFMMERYVFKNDGDKITV